MICSKRDFLKQIAVFSAGLTMSPRSVHLSSPQTEEFFEISLAEWSIHRTLESRKMPHLDFPVRARKDFDIGIVEYVDSFFKEKPGDSRYLNELTQRCRDHGIRNHLLTTGHGWLLSCSRWG